MARSHEMTIRDRVSLRHPVLAALLGVLAASRLMSDVSDLGTILADAARYESRIQSGRVHRTEESEFASLTRSQLMAIYRDPKEVEIRLMLAKARPDRFRENGTLLFSNAENCLLDVAAREDRRLSHRVFLSPKVYTTQNSMDPKGVEYANEVLVRKPIWPPYSPYDLLLGRFWSARQFYIAGGRQTTKLLSYDSAAGQAIFLLIGGPRSDFDEKIWVDVGRGYAVTRTQAIDKKGQMRAEMSVTYRQYPGGIWYPQQFVDRYYLFDAQGTRYLGRTVTTSISEAKLNVPVSQSDLQFGDTPRRAYVQDDRFSPPLVYVQGTRQLTDKDLFQMAKNRQLLNDPNWFDAAPPVATYVLIASGLLLLIGALFMLRRSLMRSSRV